ncbi:MAG: ABC transporter permease [Myxococcales bacterium]|nr:ABC transporter permease [Myxococcales bacterium]
MAIGHLAQIVLAESIKLQSRTSARLGWVMFVLLGIGVPVMLGLLGTAPVEVNGNAVGIDTSPANGVRWSLMVRNFYIAQAFVLLLASVSFAGEFQARSLREDLVRPVPRWALLLAKWGAVGVWAAAGLVVQWLVAVLVSFLALSGTGEAAWSDVFLGFLSTWITDMGFAAVVFAVATLTRTVAGTITSVFLFLVLERVVSWSLTIGKGLRDSLTPDLTEQIPAAIDWMLAAGPYLPSNGWAVWSELANGVDPSWQAWLVLVLTTTIGIVVAERRFAATDVP